MSRTSENTEVGLVRDNSHDAITSTPEDIPMIPINRNHSKFQSDTGLVAVLFRSRDLFFFFTWGLLTLQKLGGFGFYLHKEAHFHGMPVGLKRPFRPRRGEFF